MQVRLLRRIFACKGKPAQRNGRLLSECSQPCLSGPIRGMCTDLKPRAQQKASERQVPAKKLLEFDWLLISHV